MAQSFGFSTPRVLTSSAMKVPTIDILSLLTQHFEAMQDRYQASLSSMQEHTSAISKQSATLEEMLSIQQDRLSMTYSGLFSHRSGTC